MKINEVHSIRVEANNPQFDKHIYTELYGGVSGCSITINGQPIVMCGSLSININVKSASGGIGCYLLGVGREATYADPNLGSISVQSPPPVNSNYITYAPNGYVNIGGGLLIY